MKSLIVYESMFGDTQLIADAIADGLSAQVAGDVADVVEVGTAPTSIGTDVDLLVVGGPTHAFSMSRPSSREDATRQANGHSTVSHGRGIREWLEILSLPADLATAAFDTKMSRPRLPGSAGRAAEKRLRRKGCRIIAPAEDFFVAGTQGPLVDGEQVRARSWGADLAFIVAGT